MTKKEIEEFFTKRFKIYKAEKITLKVSENNLNTTRTTFIVSSAVNKNAVARNKTRRRMSEIVRSINVLPKYDFVFSIKLEEKKPYSFKFIKGEINKLLKLCGAL